MAKQAVLAALLCLGACTTWGRSDVRPFERSPSFAFAGTHWLRSDDAEASPHYPTINFTADSASGYAGCNTWRASITTRRATALAFGPVATTRMTCPPSSMQTERNFLAMLRQTRAYLVTDKGMTLYDSRNRIVAELICADESCPNTTMESVAIAH